MGQVRQTLMRIGAGVVASWTTKNPTHLQFGAMWTKYFHATVKIDLTSNRSSFGS
jgi:hypothetical protein